MRVAALLLCLALVAGACQDEEPTTLFPTRTPAATPSSADSRLIVLIGSMSDKDAWRGEDAFEGAHLAVYSSLNRDLQPDEPGYELVALDDHGDVETATRLIQEQAASSRVAGIVYAGPTEAIPPTEGALADAGIPLITCYGDLYGARLLSPHVFQLSPSLVWESRSIARYFLKDRRYERIGMLSPNDLGGRTARHAFASALNRFGGRLVASEEFEPGAENFTNQLSGLRSHKAQALFIPAAPRDFETALRDLGQLGARYRTTKAALAITKRTKPHFSRPWRPQVAGSDLSIAASIDVSISAGTVAADSYARGAHYLPIPSFTQFREAFSDWWGDEPIGWEQRAYEGVRLVGWADERADVGEDLAAALQDLRSERFGGLDISFGPRDHAALDPNSVGLWVVPRPHISVTERDRLPKQVPWVPLERTFSLDGKHTDMAREDWSYLFRGSGPENRAPLFARAIFGVVTTRKDPVH